MQKRLAFTPVNFPETHAKKIDKEQPAPRQKLDDLLSETSHAISLSGTRTKCDLCLSNLSITDPACRQWLKTKCMPEGADNQCPQELNTLLEYPCPYTLEIKCHTAHISI